MATSALKQAILDMKAQCAAIPGIAYCAINNNQVQQVTGGHTFAFSMPAILISIYNPEWGEQLLGSGVTVNEMLWKINIVHYQLDSGDGGMDEDTDVFDLRDLVKTALTGFRPTNCSALMYRDECQDYCHNSIYVYTICFKCSYVDTKGSPYDVDSTVWTDGMLTDYNLNTFLPWTAGKAYTANADAVIENDLIYLCTTTNSDAAFTTGHWQLIPAWAPAGPYTATTSYAAYQNHIYQCTMSNTNATFVSGNWVEIV